MDNDHDSKNIVDILNKQFQIDNAIGSLGCEIIPNIHCLYPYSPNHYIEHLFTFETIYYKEVKSNVDSSLRSIIRK